MGYMDLDKQNMGFDDGLDEKLARFRTDTPEEMDAFDKFITQQMEKGVFPDNGVDINDGLEPPATDEPDDFDEH